MRRRSLLVLPLALLACRPSGPAPLSVRQPLHLEEHLEAARIEGSEVPKDLPEAVEWRFGEPQPGWKTRRRRSSPEWPAAAQQADGALRIELTEANRRAAASAAASTSTCRAGTGRTGPSSGAGPQLPAAAGNLTVWLQPAQGSTAS